MTAEAGAAALIWAVTAATDLLLILKKKGLASAFTRVHATDVRHRWCELVVKHRFSEAYGDVERFLIHDQAMGVYLYGELMVQEDARQQALARRCLELLRGEMDPSARRVVEEMVL